MSRLALLLLVDPVATFDLKSWRSWVAGTLVVLGSVGGWKFVGYLYVELIRDRIDRFIFDARGRHPVKEAALVLAVFSGEQPEVDASRLESLRRHPGEFRDLIREALAEDYERAAHARREAAESLQLAQANASAIEGLSAAQLAQGHVLADVPHLRGVLEQVAATIERFDTTLRDMSKRQESMAGDLGTIKGAFEQAQRQFPLLDDRRSYRRQEDIERVALLEGETKPTREPIE